MKVEALLIVHADQVLTVGGSNERPRTGTAIGDVGMVDQQLGAHSGARQP